MKIYLSAMGWVTDAPAGNRLRWHYPVQHVDNGKYLGFPQKLVVERAPVDSQDLLHSGKATVAYPVSWWDAHGDVSLASIVPLLTHPLPAPVQAVTFVWRGPLTLLLFMDGDKRIAQEQAVDGETIYVEAAQISTIVALGTHGVLEHLRTLDLFRNRDLNWRPLAEISVAASFGNTDLATVKPRYNATPTLSAVEWTKLVKVANEAAASTPAEAQPGSLRDWDSFSMVISVRWEYAVLAGFAFFDGPHTAVCPLDQIPGRLLDAMPGTIMAYRIRDVSGPAGRSNLVLCLPVLAPALNVPAVPAYANPEVRLRRPKTDGAFLLPAGLTLKGAMAKFSPHATFEGDYQVQAVMHWQQSDPRAIGAEIDEQISASAILDSAARRSQFFNRSRRPEDVFPNVSLARSFEVAFPDVTLVARARAVDAWDRVSGYSNWCPATPLKFRHEPDAPPLAHAAIEGNTVSISRAAGAHGVQGVPDWEPDAFVKKVSGNVFVYRQTVPARAVDATFGMPIPISDNWYRCPVSGVANLADFVGGIFLINGYSETIRSVGGGEIQFRTDKKSFTAGKGRLLQDQKFAALWTHVASIPIPGLPVDLVFNESLPPPAGTAIEAYCIRLSYYGRLGPASNIVRAIRRAPVPVIPPPFTVEILGVDFFHRTMVKIRFTNPVSGGRFTVWWASGVVDALSLAQVGVSGHYVEQQAQQGFVLYDLLALPVPRNVSRTVTVGVQRVAEGGLRSDFSTVETSIPPLSG